MKTFPRTPQFILIAGLAGIFATTGCDQQASEEVVPESGCRLQNYALTAGQPGNGTPYKHEKATYTYNAGGNLLNADTTVTAENDGLKTNSRYLSAYRYDAEGFLITHTSTGNEHFEQKDGRLELRKQSTTVTYAYADGKLSGYVYKQLRTNGLTNVNGLSTTITGRYEYEAGNVIKHHQKKEYAYDPSVVKEVPMYRSGSEYTWVYSDGLLVDYIERAGGAESHPLTIRNGLILKASHPEGFSLYEYDNQDRLTKMTWYHNNALNSYYTQEWADGLPAAAALPRFKGFPQIELPGGKVGVLQKFSYYADVEGKGVKLLNESTNAVQFNARGFVTSITSTQRNLIDYFNGSEYSETTSPAPLLITYDCK